MNIRRSLLFSFSSAYARLGMQFVASLFIARLLTPREFGIFSIAMVLIYLADTLRNFGVVQYVIQEKDLTPARINSALGLNILASWGMGLAVGGLAWPAAAFYGEPGVREVMWVLSLNFFLLPAGSTMMSYMHRELMFDRVAVIQVSSALVQSIGAVAMAFAGFSYLSMAWSSVLSTVVTIHLVWRLRPAGLRIVPGLGELRHVLRFGVLSTVTHLVREGGQRLPDILLGRLINVEAVAYFSRAGGLIELFHRLVLNAVAYVALPHFAAQVRKRENLEHTYLLGAAHITALAWPFLLVLGACAPHLVPFLYGHQWGASVPLVQILCLGELLLAPFYLQSQMLVAMGRIGVDTALTILIVAARLPPLLLLADQGLITVTIGFAATHLVAAVASYVVLRRVVGCSTRNFLRALRPSLVISACVGLALLVARALAAHGLAALLLSAAAAAAGWLLGVRLARHPLQAELTSLAARVRKMRARAG